MCCATSPAAPDLQSRRARSHPAALDPRGPDLNNPARQILHAGPPDLKGFFKHGTACSDVQNTKTAAETRNGLAKRTGRPPCSAGANPACSLGFSWLFSYQVSPQSSHTATQTAA